MMDLIAKTRDRVSLTKEDAARLIAGIVDGTWPDYQIVAWLMAAYCQGLQEEEIFWLTDEVAQSGHQVQNPLGLVDKHSTGGVGDKTTLIVAPLVASLGVPVAKMSGRGLGHTGGTIDKLESIPGFSVTLTQTEIMRQMERVGVAVVAQSEELAPADKKMYALRDVTATIDSIPLIAISIMSKKLASGSPNIVLDVKVGNGAFMKSLDRAQALAELMVRIGTYHGRNVRALLTRMDRPLGFAVGNALEVNEARQCLQGKGPQDLRDEVIALASHMVSMVQKRSIEAVQPEVMRALDDGSAWAKFEAFVAAQRGDVAAIQHDLPLAPFRQDWLAQSDITVTQIDTLAIGEVALNLGAGRRSLDARIDPQVGLLCYAKPGLTLRKGEKVATVYGRSDADVQVALTHLQHAVSAVPQEQAQSYASEQSVIMEIVS